MWVWKREDPRAVPRELGYVEIKPKKSPQHSRPRKAASKAGGKKRQFHLCSGESVSRREGPHCSVSAAERMRRRGPGVTLGFSSVTRDWAPCVSDFPDNSVGKESARNAGDLGSIPELGRSPGEGKGYPLQYSRLENSMD